MYRYQKRPKVGKSKFWYKSLDGLMVLMSLFLTAIPIYYFVYYLALIFNIDGGVILKNQTHCLIFSVLSIIVFIAFTVSAHLFLFYLVGRFNHWSFRKLIDIFRNNFSEH